MMQNNAFKNFPNFANFPIFDKNVESTMEIIFDDDNNVTININNTINNTVNRGTMNNKTTRAIKNDKIYDDDYTIDSLFENCEVFNDDVFINDSDAELVQYFKDDKFRKLFFKSLNNASYNIAEVFWYINKDKYMRLNKNWFIFDNIWKPLENNTQIKEQIQIDLQKYYKKIVEYLEKKYDKTDKNYKNKMKHAKKLARSFETAQQKNDVSSEIENLYRCNDEKNEKKLNTNSKLLGFGNGVFDFNKLAFRNGLPHDYITMSVGYDYVAEKSEHYGELINFLENIQPNIDDRNYLLTMLSFALVGDNTQELFHIFSGNNTNGKNKLVELLKHTFGEYFEMISPDMLSKKQTIRRTDLLVLKNKRMAIAHEPTATQKLNASVVKIVIGNDLGINIFIRNDFIHLNPQLTLILLHNTVPTFDNNNSRIWNRTRSVKFLTKSTNNQQTENKLHLWKNDFMLLLIEYYIKYTHTNLFKISPNVEEFSIPNKIR